MGAFCKSVPLLLVDDCYIAFNAVYRPLIQPCSAYQYLHLKVHLLLYILHPIWNPILPLTGLCPSGTLRVLYLAFPARQHTSAIYLRTPPMVMTKPMMTADSTPIQ